jgi:hypothetical protein
MYQTINLHDFRKAFQEIRPNNFSYEGLETLFNHFEQLEHDLSEKIELDVIAICCDYNEETLDEIINSYDIEIDENENKLEQVKYFLDQNTITLGILDDNETIIYQNF